MNRIDQRALDLLDEVGITGPAVDVDAIARHLDITVTYENLDTDVSGMLYRQAGQPAVIAVNARHAPVRQRFTIAHELGHHQLHPGRPVTVDHLVRARVNYRDTTSSLATDREEIDANRFGAALLMPASWVVDHLDHLGTGTASRIVTALADTFDVSQQAMENRLINLGLRATP